MFFLKIKTIKFFDKYFGSFLCSLLSVFNRKKNFKEPGKILIIQLWGIGETILTLPAIRGLRKRFPKSKITVLTTKNVDKVFYNNIDLNEITVIDLNPISIIKFVIKNYKKFDLVVDFEEYLNISSIISFFAGNHRIGFSHGKRALLYNKTTRYNDKQHVVKTCLDLVGLVGAYYEADKLIKLNYPKEDKKHVENLFKKYRINKKDFLIGINPGSSDVAVSRMWPMSRFAELSEQLIEKYNAKIIFVGSKKEIELINKIQNLMKKESINLAGKTNLNQLFCLVENFDFFVSNDTGPMHIAAAQGVKTIGLFGPNLPTRFGPYGKNNIGIYKGAECSPCINVHLGQVPECRWKGKDYQKCMKKISVEDVMEGVDKLIKTN